MQKKFRLFRHSWYNEYHRNPLFRKNEHHIGMVEFLPYFTENGEKRVKVEVTDFKEVEHWEGTELVTEWNKEVCMTKDLSRDEANAEWVKAKNVKYVTQRTPKELIGYIN